MSMKHLKKKREETDRHFLGWLEGTSMVVGHWGTGLPADLGDPAPEGVDLQSWYTDPEIVSHREDSRLEKKQYPFDIVPIAIPDINTIPLALYLGAVPTFTRTNIWYQHTDLGPEQDRPLVFDPDNPWFKTHLSLLSACKAKAGGRYNIGMLPLAPNLDALVELRGAQQVLMDMVLSPEWVHDKLAQLNEVSFRAFELMAPLCTDEKGWMTHGYFMFRGPGTLGLCQCDTAAMISEEMFREFVAPYMAEQCAYYDYTLYHVDGPAALRTVDALLEIEDLTALQFTPGPQVPQGGDPKWFDLYKKIKSAGKSVMAVWIEPEEIVSLLDAVGPEGMYLMLNITREEQVEKAARMIEAYR